MKYTYEGHTFDSSVEYRAARRDADKISRLKRVGNNKSDIALNYIAQIRKSDLKFETSLGKDFEKNLYKALSLEQGTAPKKVIRFKYRQILKVTSLFILFILLIVVGILLFTDIYHDRVSRKSISELQEIKANAQLTMSANADRVVILDAADKKPRLEVLPQYIQLHDANEDFAGWLMINGTKVNYPVMHLDNDNDFYLCHDFYGNEDKNGLLVLDKRCDKGMNDNHILIHGHNMKSGYMFGELSKYEHKKFYEEHPMINLDTLYEHREYEIISVFISSVDDADTRDFRYYDYITLDNKEDFDAYIYETKKASLYDIDGTAQFGDTLITLSTCEYSKKNGRLVIVGKRQK